MKKKKSKRNYDTTSRDEKTEVVQIKIIETYVALLTERRGAEVSIQEVAEKSSISERTIYRLFNDKANLSLATEQYAQAYLATAAEQIATKDVASFAKNLFEKFDENENLVVAYLYSNFGAQARLGFRKKFNQLIIQKILTEQKLTLTKEREKKIAVITSMINAKIWNDIRNEYGFKGADVGDAMSEAIAVLISKL